MPVLKWFIPCASVSIDQFTNTISLFHVVEELTVPANTPDPGPKHVHPAEGFVLVSHWERSTDGKPEKARARITVNGAGRKKPLGDAQFDVDLSTAIRARQLSQLRPFPYAGTGKYEIRVYLLTGKKWREVGSTAILVKKGSDPMPVAKH